MHPMILNRRALLSGIGGSVVALSAGDVAFARSTGKRKIVLVILRGAMDGLAAVAPVADPAYAAARGALALAPQGMPDGVLPLTEGFGLHPRLQFLHSQWQANHLAILHAACSPYRSRSHFDGQDVLENGGATPFGLSDGWLNRALTLLGPSREAAAVSVGSMAPTVLKGSAPVTSWTRPTKSEVPASTVARLTDLYAGDPLLSPALARAVDTAALIGDRAGNGMAGGPGQLGAGAYKLLAAAAARIVAAPGGPSAAVISLDGWDTHANQGAAKGGLSLRLGALDTAMATLQQELGPVWADTAVIITTEFGRTVSANGTNGTDHGTGGAALLLGGSVRGGRMLGDWPTLAPKALFEGRDLAPVNDVRSLFGGVLQAQWGLDTTDLQRSVFPGGSFARPRVNLIV